MSAFALSSFLAPDRKFVMEHIQNATLAGYNHHYRFKTLTEFIKKSIFLILFKIYIYLLIETFTVKKKIKIID